VQARDQKTSERPPLKLLLWTAIAGLIFGLIGFGEIAEDWFRVARNKLHVHEASGDIVLVKIDEEALAQVGRWPWPRQYHAQLTDSLTRAGARQIFFDVGFVNPGDPEDDRAFAEALERSKVVLAAWTRVGPNAGVQQDGMPLAKFAARAEVASISAEYNYQNAVWRVPYATSWKDQTIPSLAAKLARRTAPAGTTFIIDYSIDPNSIPAVSAARILKSDFDSNLIRGKDIVIGTTSNTLGDIYFIPGTGQMGGVYIQILGAETLKSGRPFYLGWAIALFIAVAAAAVAVTRRRPYQRAAILGSAALLFLFAPALLEANLIFVDITPALFVIAWVAGSLTWRRYRQGGMTNPVSGLPNLSALRFNREGRDQALIAARILNYSEIAAALPASSEEKLIDQIVSRLRVGAPERTLYHGDDGIFAWFEEPRVPFGHHLEALYTLFRTPAKVSGQQIDLSISFGVEIGSGRSLANRFGSALVAADEAAHDGLKWKYHDPESLQDASWKLSMLSQLDAAVDKGEVWVAYQPQLDLKTRRIIGAEALARWTHPKKGPIAATEFIAAAEQHDRIGKLTDFVLEQAIASASAINRRHPDFRIAVNLSARLLNDQGLLLRLSAMLARHRLAPQLLTLELTETAALGSSGGAFDMLAALRDLGVTISIDDYGTGLSTLEYLRKIPASELKIDQSFVKGMVDNRSDRLMVQSTIALAHSLGRKVVAEGVERTEILEALSEVQCDVAQGFAIGRPVSLESLNKRLATDRRRRVA